MGRGAIGCPRPGAKANSNVLIWMAVSIAAALTLLSLRSMAHAFAVSLGSSERPATLRPHGMIEHVPADASRPGRTEFWMLLIEILFSIAITMLIIGFSFAAAMPGRLMVGALLAQVAVIGSLLAPAITHEIRGIVIRPAALALGIAQLAHIAFFVRAIQALTS